MPVFDPLRLHQTTLVEAVFFDLHDQARAADAELLGKFGFIPSCAAEAFADHVALEILQSIFEFAVEAGALTT